MARSHGAYLGTLPERIDGVGILIRGGGLREIDASGDGLLSKLDVRLNDHVTLNQVIGEVKGVGVAERLTEARQKAETARREAIVAQGEDEATDPGRARHDSGLPVGDRSVRRHNSPRSGTISSRSRRRSIRD